MIILRESIKINRPLPEVYEYLVHVENVQHWQPAVIEVKHLTEGPTRLGSQFREVAKMMGKKINTVCTITELEVNKRFGFKGTSDGPIEYETLYTLEIQGEGTHLDVEGKFTVKGLWKLIEPVLRSQVRKESKHEIHTMKSMIESRP